MTRMSITFDKFLTPATKWDKCPKCGNDDNFTEYEFDEQLFKQSNTMKIDKRVVTCVTCEQPFIAFYTVAIANS